MTKKRVYDSFRVVLILVKQVSDANLKTLAIADALDDRSDEAQSRHESKESNNES